MVATRNFPVNAGAGDPADISAHNSPSLARNPVDPANLIITNRIDTPSFSCAVHVSFDGGASFSETAVPVPRGEQPKCYAPDVTFDAQGTAYVSYVMLFGRGNVPNGAWIAASDDGGRTLSDPVKVLDELAFQVRLVADPVIPERLYLTWLQAEDVALLRFVDAGNPINFKSSDDGATTWSDPQQINDPARQRVVAPSLAVGPEGVLYALYVDLVDDRLDYDGAHEGRGGPPYPGKFQLVLARSDDSGETWTESVVEDALTPSERFIVFIPPSPSLAVDSDSGHVYVSFHDSRMGDRDVWVWTSEDGSEFTDAVRVNDTAERDGSSQYLPKIAVAPNGRLDVVYYDRRADDEDVMNEVSFQFSLDDGRSFSQRLLLSDGAFDSTIGFGSQRDLPDLGSRLALLSTVDKSLAVWADTRAGTEASGKQDLVRGLVAFSRVPQPPSWAGDVLRYGGFGLGVLGLLLLASAVVSARRPVAPV